MRPARKFSIADAYTLAAALFGVAFIAITPPFAVGDETTHYERAYEVATGAFLGGEGLPSGTQQFLDDAFGRVKSGEPITAADYARWAEIELVRDRITPYPEPLRAIMRLQYPGNYVHLAPAMAGAIAVGAPPLAILYLLRAVSLFVGVALVRQAIRIAPAMFRESLAFLALLPTSMVFFSGVSIDSALIGLAFLYFALVANFAARVDERLSRSEILALIALGAIVGQFKSGYLLLPTLALILPATKFSSLGARIIILALVMAPGALASLAWVATAKTAMLGDIIYSTAPGNRVAPDEQIAFVLSDPLRYAGILLRTLFATPVGASSFMYMLALGGWTNIVISPPAYMLLAFSAIVLWASGEKAPAAMTTPLSGLIQAGIFSATTVGIMTAMYVGWTGVGAATVEGFQGRYWIAIAPLLLALAPYRFSLFADPGRRLALAFGAPAIGLVAMAAAVIAFFY